MTVKAIKSGAVEFLTKPFDDHDLLNAIQQAFDPAVTVAPSLVGAPGNGTIAGDCDRAAASE